MKVIDERSWMRKFYNDNPDMGLVWYVERGWMHDYMRKNPAKPQDECVDKFHEHFGFKGRYGDHVYNVIDDVNLHNQKDI